MYIIYNILIYSMLGFILEISWKKFTKKKIPTGILKGPYCPVYGIGSTIIFIVFYKLEFIKNYLLLNLTYFFSSFFILTILEFIGGKIIKKKFNIDFWNYTKQKFNIGKYISVMMSVKWSVLAIISYNYILPITDKLYKITNQYILILIFIIFILDFLFTFFNKKKKSIEKIK